MNRSLLLTRSVTKVAASAVITLLLWAFTPILVGWTPVVITSGSMTPMVQPGDIVVTSPVDDPATLALGDVVTYRRPGNDRRVTHRIHSIGDDGVLRTKGDANQHPDSDPLTSDRVEGRGRLLVPYAGLAATSPTARSVAGGLLLLAVVVRIRARRAERPDRPPVPRGTIDVPVVAAVSAEMGHPMASVATRSSRLMTAHTPPVLQVAIVSAPTAVMPTPRLWTAGVRQRLAVRRRRQAGGATVALLLAAVAVPVAGVAAFTGVSGQPGTFVADVIAPPGNLDGTGACNATTAEVTLTWDASTTVDVDGYVLLRSDNDGPANPVATVDPTTTSWVDTSPPDGTATYTAHATLDPWHSTDTSPTTVTVPTC